MEQLTEQNFEEQTKSGICVLDFWAEWCGPCRLYGPIFEEASKEVKDVKFFKVNVDNNRHLALKFGVMGIPTTIILKDGKVKTQLSGAMAKQDLVDWVKNNR